MKYSAYTYLVSSLKKNRLYRKFNNDLLSTDVTIFDS